MFSFSCAPGRQILRGWLALVFIGVLLVPAAGLRAASAPAGATSTADIVVQFGNGEVVTKRIAFSGTISGLEALRLTGLDLVEKNGGVCRIGDTGCGAEQDCFCACPPPFTTCLFWSYQRWDGSAWVAASQGAASTTVTDGAVEGWTWGRELPAPTPALLGAEAGLGWLRPLQGLDGSYANGNMGLTIDTILASRALGGDADAWRRAGGASLLDAVAAGAPAYAAQGAASVGKLALGVAAADQDPRSFAGLNLVVSATATLDAGTGAYGTTNWDQALAILGLRAAREPVPAVAVTLLRGRANSDGSWGFVAPGDGDVDSTGLVVQALVAAGVPASDVAITKALDYLDAAQNSDGGFPFAPEAGGGDTSNVNSTALATQAILAAGAEPLDARWRPAATNPITYLLSLQQADGAFTFGGQASLLATQQAIPALAGRALPLASRAVAQRAALSYIGAQQQLDGSFTGFGVGATIDAILAIAAAGGSPRDVRSASGQSALDYLRPRAAAYAAGSAAATGKLVVGLVAAGEEPRQFAGLNLVISTTLRYDPGSGAFGSSTYDQAWSILGLAAAGASIPVSATDRLQAIASPGGGWGFVPNDANPDPDTTGLALMALAAAGVGRDPSSGATGVAIAGMGLCATGPGSTNPAVLSALAYLRGALNPDGGFPGFGGATSASSTGLALQGLAAYGDTPRSLSWSAVGGAPSDLTRANPVDTLLGLQTGEGGFPGFGGPNDPDATYQALPGLLGSAFPTSTRTLVYLPGVIST